MPGSIHHGSKMFRPMQVIYGYYTRSNAGWNLCTSFATNRAFSSNKRIFLQPGQLPVRKFFYRVENPQAVYSISSSRPEIAAFCQVSAFTFLYFFVILLAKRKTPGISSRAAVNPRKTG